MVWSFSAYRTFQKCPRQWFYKNVLANARAKDPLRREAHRLSKLEGIEAWRGKIVDATISDTIVPSIMRGMPYSLSEAQVAAKRLFQQQKAERTVGQGKREAATSKETKDGSFFELEYGLTLTDEMFAQAWTDVSLALENFYKSQLLWTLLREAKRLLAQRPLSFKYGDISIRVVPDLIVFRQPQAPAVLDWKVNARPARDYWLQLVIGAVALTRCTPHRDWPAGAVCRSPQEIELLEVQLLTGDVRPHTISGDEVEDAEDVIAVSAMEMQLAGIDGIDSRQRPEDYPVTQDPRVCQTCPFRRLCWETIT